MASEPASPADGQLQFLKNLQRLLDEGTFTSTYKFALLLALADLAVERGDVGGEPLPVEAREIADKRATGRPLLPEMKKD